MERRIDRIGEISINSKGTLMKIIKYKDINNIIVEFQDEYKYRTKTTYRYFKNGKVSNPYDKTIFKVGYIGEEIINNNFSKNISYTHWYAMIRRVYSEKQLQLKPTYKRVEVCEEWLNYTNFKKWFEENYYIIEGQQMELDKDIIEKGNKIYCPEKCIFLPHSINSLFTKSNKSRGKLPIGVFL